MKLYCEVAQHYDYIWFEMQHSTMSYRDVEEMIAACPRPVATPIIRVPDEFESSIQKATDIGALGIVVPTVDTVGEGDAAARFARFPPEGRRSQGAGQAAAIWGVNGVNYRETINDNMLVIVQIETPVGVANAYDIAMVPGVDVVLGVERRHDKFLRAAAGASASIRAVHADSRRDAQGRQVSRRRHGNLRQGGPAWSGPRRFRRLAVVLQRPGVRRLPTAAGWTGPQVSGGPAPAPGDDHCARNVDKWPPGISSR